MSQQQSQRLEDEKELQLTTDAFSNASLKKKKKKSHSLVRKLSLNKFRMSSEQELRRTPEGGNSSRSQSQSSQESPVHIYDRSTKKENDDAAEREKRAKEKLKKPEKLPEKPTKTVSIVQCKSPSLTIKSFAGTGEPSTDAYGSNTKSARN